MSHDKLVRPMTIKEQLEKRRDEAAKNHERLNNKTGYYERMKEDFETGANLFLDDLAEALEALESVIIAFEQTSSLTETQKYQFLADKKQTLEKILGKSTKNPS